MARVGDHVRQRTIKTPIDKTLEYTTMGVRWYGRGAYLRAPSKPQAAALTPAGAGDLVFCRIDAQKGPFAVVPEEFDGALVTNEFPLYVVDESAFDARFLALSFARPSVLEAIDRARSANGNDGRARWKTAEFESQHVPMPPLEEQRRIVALVDSITEASTALTDEAEALAGVLRVRRAELLVDQAIETVRADEAFHIRLGRQRSPERATGPSMTPYMRSANVGYDELRMDDVLSMDFDARERERYRLEEGDVLVSEGSASPTAVGMPAVWHDELEGPVCFQNTLLRFRAVEGVTTPEFARHWCLWAYESGAFRDTAGEAPGVRHIGFKKASAMRVGLPTLGEQDAITDALSPMADAIATLKSEAARLLALRGALLEALLAGEVDLAALDAED